MLSLLTEHPLICALLLILTDLVLWRLIGTRGHNVKLLVRVVIFSLFSLVLFWNPRPGMTTCRCTWRPPVCRSAGGCSLRAP